MELRNGKKITINSTLALEPYITVPKDILFNLKKIDEKRIKEIVSYDCHGHLYTALLCYKYPMTDYGYRNTRSFLERFAKICSKIETNSFDLACDMASYGFKVQYNQYIERFIKGDREDLEDLQAVCKLDTFFYSDRDHFNNHRDYLMICHYA